MTDVDTAAAGETAAADHAPLLQVRGLRKYFPVRRGIFLRHVGDVHAVDDVSFDIRAGETLGLVGESGCGKSTVGKTLLQLHRPDDGDVTFGGQSLGTLNGRELRSLRGDMQIVFQDPFESLNARHSVGRILEEPLLIHKAGDAAQRRARVAELLERVGLPASAATRYPHEFSGGQRQRIGIARAIALKPKLIVCDEAVSALDVSVQAQILNLLLELQQEMNLALLFIGHDLAVVKHVSDHIAVMYLGEIVELAPSEALYEQPRHPYTQALLSAIPIPEPTQRAERIVLQGDVPSPIDPPPGCRFHTRCSHARDICRTKAPTLEAVPPSSPGLPGSQVACHRWRELSH